MRRGKRLELIKSETKKGRKQQTLRKSRELSAITLKIFIKINWKI
jgi:hypothetical protein